MPTVKIPVVEIAHLAPPAPLGAALDAWRGFAELAPASRSRPGKSYLELPEDSAGAWTWRHTPAVPLPPLGCSFVRDVELSGSGYLFHAGRFVREPTHTARVALQWLGDPDFHDNPLAKPRRNRIEVDRPALIVFGPGSSIYGHWLMDFLPRVVVAQRLLGAAAADWVLPLPADTPDWVPAMLAWACGVEPGRILRYSRHDDLLFCRRACLPTVAHDGEYGLHPLVRTFYDGLGEPAGTAPHRRLCISRRNLENAGFSYARRFEVRQVMEDLAAAAGYDVVCPEELGFPDQVRLFRSAHAILGEFGSGMHNAVFAAPGTVVGVVGWYSHVQAAIAAAFEQRLLFMNRIRDLPDGPGGTYRYTAREAELRTFLAMMARLPATPLW